MKRDRDDEDERSLIRSTRAFRFSPESLSSQTTTSDILNSTLFSTTLVSRINNNSNNINANTNIDASGKDANNSRNNNDDNNTKDPDQFLPIANVGRIMKKVIPGNGKISKDAKETVKECVSEFISFVTGEASDKCQREKRKTINGDDILWAIMTLGFDDYVDPLKLYLTKYRDVEGEKLNIPKQQRVEEFWPHEQNPNDILNIMHPVVNMHHVPSFGTDDPLSLDFYQSSGQPQQDHAEHGNW